MSSEREANEVIADLLALGHDYTANFAEIEQFYDEYMMDGNYDGTLDIEGKKAIRFIQEDEYDNARDDRPDEVPDWDEQVCYSAGHYIFLVD